VEVGGLTIQAFPTDHRMDRRGYRIAQHHRPPTVDVARVHALGLMPGPWLATIKSGGTVELAGREITAAEVCEPLHVPLSVALTGDTAASDVVLEAVRGVDVLVHDATFADDKASSAAHWGHATARQAAEIANAAGVRALVLTHLSHRYPVAALPHAREAAEAFAGVIVVAKDGDTMNARTLALTPAVTRVGDSGRASARVPSRAGWRQAVEAVMDASGAVPRVERPESAAVDVRVSEARATPRV